MKQQTNYYFWSHPDDNTIFDVYELFQYYDHHFFRSQLQKCTVRWTKRMTQCAGTCKYEGFGSSTISLSEPLLKFRNSNQLKQTLLHEMIHAYLFKTNPAACQTDGGHGPAFKQIMATINKATGLNITVYHSFHDEVAFYRQHVWRCNGRCREDPPYYGYVKRSMNRAPQPADFWFAEHRRACGGQFQKISGPDKQKPGKKQRKSKKISEQKDLKKWGYGKSIADYLKQMGNQKKENSSRQKSQQCQISIEQKKSRNEKLGKGKEGHQGKSIADYCAEIQKQEKQSNQQKKVLEANKQEKQKFQFEKLLSKYCPK